MGVVATATADGTATERGATDPADDSIHAQDAIETRRSKITALGASDGSGPPRGIAVYNGSVYAWRDNAAGTECFMYKATSAGWIKQDLGNRVSFTLGTAAFLEGETLTGATSTATATIKRVVKQTGDWSTNDAAGYIIIDTVTGGPYQAEVGTSASGSATLSGAETANTIQPGGRFEFRVDNFFASTETKRLYGVSGVDFAFEWDGSVYVPIITNRPAGYPDTPAHLEINELHLMLSYENGLLQNSATGTPYVWSGGGSLEQGMGADIVAMRKEVGEAMVILCTDRIKALYGKNTVDSPFDLRNVTDESGGIEWSLQRMAGATRYADDRGFMDLRAVQEYGDFGTGTYGQFIEPLYDLLKATLTATSISKKKSQYRMWFDGGKGIYATFNNNKLAGFSLVTFTDANNSGVPVRVTGSGEDSSGNEIAFFGSDNGFVYQFDSGPSFDGAQISATILLAYDHQNYPAHEKEYLKSTIETNANAGTELKYNTVFSYGSSEAPASPTETFLLESSGALWNQATWNNFIWASDDVGTIEAPVNGRGSSIALQIFSSSIYTEPHTLLGIIHHYKLRRIRR